MCRVLCMAFAGCLSLAALGQDFEPIQEPSYDGQSGDYLLTVSVAAGGPANDDCVNAQAIGEVVDLPFDTTLATNDSPAGHCSGMNNCPNIWYCYTPSCTGLAYVSLCGSTFDTYLGVYDGCTCDPVGAQLCCNDDYCGLQSQCDDIPVTAGQQYLIEVGGYSTNSGTGILNVWCVGIGPPNDNCADAIPVDDGDVITGSLAAATNDGDASCGSSTGNLDVWYVFTASCEGVLRVNTCGTHDAPGQDLGMDTVLSLHSGCPGTQANELECNDDWPYASSDPTACTGLDEGIHCDSAIAYPLGDGKTVYVRVSHYSGVVQDGAFTLNVDFTPENDLCADWIGVGEGVYDFCTIGAETDGPDEPVMCNFYGYTQVGSDIWFRYTASDTGTLTVSLCGSLYDTKLAFYGSAACPPTNILACNDDFCGLQSEISAPVTNGETYTIRVGGFYGKTGVGLMTVTLQAGDTRADMNCDGMIDAFDIDPFVLALTNPTAYQQQYPNCNIMNADIDCNGILDAFDIDPFVVCLTAGCPPCP